MKKVVFVTRRMIMGGIEKALISMLESMPKGEYDVTVLVMANDGELTGEIPNHVKLKCLYGDEQTTIEKICNQAKKGKFISSFRIGVYTLLSKRAKTVFDQEMYQSKILPLEDIEYDLAIAYHGPASFPVVYVMNNLKSKTKAAWIHSDVSQFEKELQPFKEFYQKYDKIFCVSKYAMNKFIEMYPNLKEKTSVFYNIISKDDIISLGDAKGFSDQFEGIRVLTVGRLSKEKGQDLIPNVLARLIKDGYKIRWYCVGEGALRNELENEIEKYNLSECLYLLGNKANPYPFFKQCDIYVQPSRYEAYCTTVAEARCFNKPIIATDVAGTNEQITNKETGYIINFSKEELYRKLRYLLENKTTRSIFEKKLRRLNINTFKEMEKLYDLFS